MAQLNIFNGGLSTRLAPHLININEALVLNNVDVSLGNLASLKTDKDENEVVGKSMIYFKNKWVYSANNLDYVIFQDKLYYSGETKLQYSQDGITFRDLGVLGPTNDGIALLLYHGLFNQYSPYTGSTPNSVPILYNPAVDTGLIPILPMNGYQGYGGSVCFGTLFIRISNGSVSIIFGHHYCTFGNVPATETIYAGPYQAVTTFVSY